MELAEKLRQLRKAEGMRRGLWRAMTQHEVIRAMRQEIGVSLSQAYLSQLEGGRRMHLSNTSREALARFYHVHPGYLVSDLTPDLLDHTSTLDTSQASQASQASPDARVAPLDAALAQTLTRLVAAQEPERALRLLDWLLRLPPEEFATLEQQLAPARRTT